MEHWTLFFLHVFNLTFISLVLGIVIYLWTLVLPRSEPWKRLLLVEHLLGAFLLCSDESSHPLFSQTKATIGDITGGCLQLKADYSTCALPRTSLQRVALGAVENRKSRRVSQKGTFPARVTEEKGEMGLTVWAGVCFWRDAEKDVRAGWDKTRI